MSSCKPIFTYFLWKNVLLLYLVGEIVHAQIRDVTSECHSPEVRNGSLANITCIFSRDIDSLKQKIYVDHIPPGRSATATPETVLQCQWSGGNFTCNPKSGYKWTGYVSNRLTFEIPVTLQTHGGQYWCEVLPSDPLNIKRCDLHVTGLNFYPVTGGSTTSITTFNDTVRTKEAVKTTCASQPVEYGSKAFVNCCFSVDIRDLKKTIFVDHLSVNGSGTPKTVLRCWWMKENILCNSSTGYHLIGNVTKELIIHIPSAHKQHAGLYWCDFLSSKPEDIKNCSLSITDVQSSFRTTVNGNTGRTDVQSSFRTTVNGNTGRTDSVTESVRKDAVNITAIAVPIAVFLATIIIIIIFACLKRYVRRRRCPCRSNSERQCRSNSERQCRSNSESQGSTNNPAQTNPESIPLQNGGPNQLTTANGGESSRLTSQFTT